MASGKLHSLSVERAHRFGGPVLLSDGDGLYFRKQTREGAAWMFRYRFAGRERWMTLGNFPDMSLAAARVEAREKRLLLDKRRDPLFAKQEAEEAQRAAIAAQKARQTFRDLAEDWYSTEIDQRRLKHPKVPRRYLDKYLLPEFGERVPAEITPADAARLLAQVGKSAPTAANDLLRFMRRVFRFGVRRHVVTSNPVADFDQSDAGGPERARKRALTVEELGQLFKALRESPSFGGANLLAVRLLLALGVRKGELLGAQWSEFDLDSASPTWRLPAGRTKTSSARRGRARTGAFHLARPAPHHANAFGVPRRPQRSGRALSGSQAARSRGHLQYPRLSQRAPRGAGNLDGAIARHRKRRAEGHAHQTEGGPLTSR
jgi:hypothetical protein